MEPRYKEVYDAAAFVPVKAGSWQIKDVPQPKRGPGQVLVKMHASVFAIPACAKHLDTSLV